LLKGIKVKFVLKFVNCFFLSGSVNSQIRYSIIKGDAGGNFSIEPNTGELQVAHPLDFELLPPTIK